MQALLGNLKPFQSSTIQLPVKALSRIAVSDNSGKLQPTTFMKNILLLLGELYTFY